MTKAIASALVGKWRIVEADLCDRDSRDLVEPAPITLADNRRGAFAFGGLQGGLDCQYSQRLIFFTRQGFDEMGEVNGDGSAELDDHRSLEIELRFHLGDEATSKAAKW